MLHLEREVADGHETSGHELEFVTSEYEHKAALGREPRAVQHLASHPIY